MKTVLLIPLKDPQHSKLRLSGLLSSEERLRVVWNMFEDLAAAVRSLVPAPHVALVTGSRPAAQKGERWGWRIFWEDRPVTESAAIDRVSMQLAREGVESVLRIPADLPLIQPEDLGSLMEYEPGPAAALMVPAWNRMGTNALLRRPPDLFPSRFGHNSLVLHIQEALRIRATLEFRDMSRLARDIDDPQDVTWFMQQASPSITFRTLVEMGIGERLKQYGT